MSSFISSRLNQDLLEEMYERWQKEPTTVSSEWRVFFEGFELGCARLEEEIEASFLTPDAKPKSQVGNDSNTVDFRYNVVSLIEAYRTLGHTAAWIDPLALEAPSLEQFDPAKFGLTNQDLEQVISTRFFRQGKSVRVKELIADLQANYCGFVGFEFMHIHNTEVREWIRTRIEERGGPVNGPKEKKRKALKWFLESEIFEIFLGKKFIGEKRFSLEGGEGLLVLLNGLLEECAKNGIENIEMGMAHRGRLNVLANFLRKSLTTILYEFTPSYMPQVSGGDGDVKYHLGYYKNREVDGKTIRVELAANPSHLEAVNAVVEGKARARQRLRGDDIQSNRNCVLPLLIHGDAAMAGQGSVSEVLNLSQLKGYRTGGTIHIVINNQIGFTTIPEDARSSAYATDIAKMIEAPILHVNGEEPMEMLWVVKFALDFRQQFNRDVVIDMYCYRRQGHNENDQTAFTSPILARKIENRQTTVHRYRDRLLAQGVISPEEMEAMESSIWDSMEKEYEEMRRLQDEDRTAFSGSTAEAQISYNHNKIETGVALEKLEHIGKVLTELPESFHVHPTLAKRFLPRRAEALTPGGKIDWAMGEALAFGSLLEDGFPIRLSGQDVRRGTFSQRHAVYFDFETQESYTPLQHVSSDQAKFTVYNSLLSEAAVLGFEYGYSLVKPEALVLWEAQFGDFANGAQVIIDQFITSAESKWQTLSSIVMLLPHGYDGQGPEHSSARLERYLQLCAENNIQVANLTTPAQYFHILRRQKMREFRKPLILMTPKSLLTRAEAVSEMPEFVTGTHFQEILDDPAVLAGEIKAKNVNRVIFCSGKVYYDLAKYRKENSISDVAIIRIEQLYPLNTVLFQKIVQNYSSVQEFVWCQEEPENMGAWSFIRNRIDELLGVRVVYAGRKRAASPAEGAKALHYEALESLLKQAFSAETCQIILNN